MATVQIDIPTDEPFYEVTVQLSEKTYLLRLEYNFRAESWYLDLSYPTNDGTVVPILAGQALVARTNFLAGVVDELAPPGTLYVWSDADPERFDLGTRAYLRYRDA